MFAQHPLEQQPHQFLKHDYGSLGRKGGLPVCDCEITDGETVLDGHLGEKRAQLSRGFELGNGVEFLERAGERIRQAPHCPWRKLLVLWLKVQAMDLWQKGPGRFQFAIYERPVENQLCLLVADLGLLPALHLQSHRLKASLNPVDANCKCVDQIEALGVLGQDRGERA